MENSIIYWCILYTSYVLMPVIPAVIIYRYFPDTTVGAKGLLGGLKINATGAFAAYMITCLLGIFIVKRAFTFIEDATNKNWTVTARIRFMDENNKPLQLNADELEIMTLRTSAISIPPDSGTKCSAKFQTKVSCTSELPCVQFNYATDDFDPAIIDLDTLKTGINRMARKINLGVVYLRKARNKYQAVEAKDFVVTGPPSNH